MKLSRKKEKTINDDYDIVLRPIINHLQAFIRFICILILKKYFRVHTGLPNLSVPLLRMYLCIVKER